VVPRTGKSSDIIRAYDDSNSAIRAVVSKDEPIFVWQWGHRKSWPTLLGISSLRNNDQTTEIWFGAARPERTLPIAQFARPLDKERGHASFRLTFIKVRHQEPASRRK
jgi:hypothetical protein